ncbi:hypothetical protein PGB90_008537 [Kerria lacca]
MALNIIIKRSLFSNNHNFVLIPIATYSSQNFRTLDENFISIKRGTGYRSSFNGIVCTVFGGSGFIGKNIIQRLGKYGTQVTLKFSVIIPYRHELYSSFENKTAGDLGQIYFSEFCLNDDDSIRKCMKYSDVVINLIGKDHDTWNYTLEQVNIEGARKIAKICKEMGIKKFIHVSALNASPNPRAFMIKNGSRFLKSKWYGEIAVREEFPEAIIVKPSDVYGEGDTFISYYGRTSRLINRTLYLWAKGFETIKQPVFVWDVSHGLYELVTRHVQDVAGKTYQFVGPRGYILHDLCKFMFANMWKNEKWGFQIEDARLDLCFQIYRIILNKFYLTSPSHLQTLERFEREHVSDEIEENGLTLKDLGIKKLINFEDMMFSYSLIWKAPGEFVDDVYQFQPPPPPKIIREI